MMLHDQDGAVIVPYGQLFEYRTSISSVATLEVVCADSAMSTTMEPIICVRLVSGFIVKESDGERVGLGPHGEQPMFLFKGELIATLVRRYKSGHTAEPAQPEHPQPAGNKPRARSSKERTEKDRPITKNLFD